MGIYGINLQESIWLFEKFQSKVTWLRVCRLRKRHVPLQYLLGTQPFNDIEVHCQPGVLIPRWETEEWCHDLSNSIKQAYTNNQKINNRSSSTSRPLKIVDLCTGSGCIPISLYHECQRNSIPIDLTAIDFSQKAINLTKLNIQSNININNNHNLDSNPPIQIHQLDILKTHYIKKKLGIDLSGNNGRFDLITCNPPYIPKDTAATSQIDPSVKFFEPHSALFGNLEFYEKLINFWLTTTNAFIYEIGDWNQYVYIKKQINNSDTLRKEWIVNLKYDSNRNIRCVWGVRRHTKMMTILNNFGTSKNIFSIF